MQYKNNYGCDQGFVPVNGNWDFNSCGDWDGCRGQRRRTRKDDCQDACRERTACQECQQGCERQREDCEEKQYRRAQADCVCTAENTHVCEQNTCTGKADCPCEQCTRSRAARSSCEKNGGESVARSYACSARNRGVGMVWGLMQEIDELYAAENALKAGTLFPELHKPMSGYYPCGENCATYEQEVAFAAWELRLYLNTHPNDEKALALFRRLCKEVRAANYATSFLTDDDCASGWSWVNNPWPWEYDCRCAD